jgi:hypothetical protein
MKVKQSSKALCSDEAFEEWQVVNEKVPARRYVRARRKEVSQDQNNVAIIFLCIGTENTL